MDRKGYKAEAKYIRVVNGWRRACDQRGLSEHERPKLNNNFLDYILDNLMPWHKEKRDFSLLEVNRWVCIKTIMLWSLMLIVQAISAVKNMCMCMV